MGNFTGMLNNNAIVSAMYNMIISQQTFVNNVDGLSMELVDMSRVDGGLYGDTKLYYSTDVLASHDWLNDAEAGDLLKLERPQPPQVQAITINQFRQIPVTIDNYLSKQAWSNENSFSTFNSVILGWSRDTKRVYDMTLFNAFIGTNQTNVGKQLAEIKLPTVAGDTEAQNKLRGAAIAKYVADLLIDVKDATRNYNDYGNLRAINSNNLVAVWNASAVNQIEKYALPVIYHKDGFIDKLGQVTLPSRYFGTVNDSGGTTPGTNTKIRSLIEKDYNDVPMNNPAYDKKKHIFAGDLLPNSQTYEANETYTQDDTILFKLMDKKSVPFMSGFEVQTSFYNPKSLTETHYLTWGYNTLEHLKEYPFITVRGVEAK